MMEFKNTKTLLSYLRRAVDQYGMIEEGDRIAVGLSGGKDSTALLIILKELQRFYPCHFEIEAFTVDSGFENMDFTPLMTLCKEIEVPYHIVESNIAHVVFETRKESNPCSLCAKMRRGLLHNAAVANSCNKVALGHHYDDAVVTFLMNLFNEGRIGCFSPKSYLSVKKLTLIRPFIYADEKSILRFVNQNQLPVVKSTCPEDKHTDREDYKEFLESLEKKDKGVKKRIFNAMKKGNVDGFFMEEKEKNPSK